MTLFYLALAWLAGIGTASLISFPWWMWLLIGGLCLLAVVLMRRQPTPRLLAGCGLLLCLGAMRFALSNVPLTESMAAYYNDSDPVSVSGVIDTAPDVRDQQVSFVLAVKSITFSDGTNKQVTGKVSVQTFPLEEYRYGDAITVGGTLETPPDGSYRAYLARQGVLSIVRYARVDLSGENAGNPFWAFLFGWREQARRNINSLLPDPESSLLSGILLGLDSGISPSLRADFNATGTSHVIAISGSNIAIVAGLILTLTRRLFKETPAAAITIVSVIIYTLFVGADAAVLRAALMTVLGLTASRLGRQTYGPASLGFAALLMTAINPLTLWDIGFQLSFMATLGLILYVNPLQIRLESLLSRFLSEGAARTTMAFISDAFIVTIAAQITTTPLIAYYFGRLSLLSLPANFLIIPLQGFLMVFGWLGVLLSFVLWPIGQLFAWIAWLFLAATVQVVQGFAGLPLASFTLEIPLLGLVVIYGVIFGITIVALQPAETRPAIAQQLFQDHAVRLPLFLGSLILAIILIASFSAPDGRLHVTIIDSGGDPATLITTPSGRTILVGAGGTGRELVSGLGQTMPFWQRRIDVLVLVDSNEDGAGALSSLIGRYQIATLMANEGDAGALVQAGINDLAQQGVSRQTVIEGQSIVVDDGVRLTVLFSQSEQPLALLLTYNKFRLLLPGSSEAPNGVLLRPDTLGAVLLIPEMPAPALTDPGFLTALQPQLIIVPTSEGDVDLSNLLLANSYTIPPLGRLEVVTDGEHITIDAR